ncbi:MAG: AIM24 family protein [Planctomycetes bacterium]|nr:AIM24 family protein [Planctomycetota bacterium]
MRCRSKKHATACLTNFGCVFPLVLRFLVPIRQHDSGPWRSVGTGTMFVTAHGGIVEQELAAGERFVLDNRNIVAFSDGMEFESVVLAGSLKDSFLSGEGFVVRFTGPGSVLYQTRARPSLGLLRGLFQSLV